MELKTESNQTQSRDRAIVYQAIGWMVGRYQPSADNPDCGMLLTEDGQTIPAQVSWHLHKQRRKKFGEVAQTANWHGEKFLWTVYPRTEPLTVQLVNINLLQDPVENATAPEAEQAKSKQAEGLKIVGQIESVAEGKISIIVPRNEKPPRGKENDVEYQPLVLQIVGSVPNEAVGQIWELELQRQKAELVVVTGKQYTPVVTRLRARKRNRASASANIQKAIDRTVPLPKPILRIKPQTDLPLTAVEQEAAAKQQEDSSLTAVPLQSSASESMLATTNVGTNKTVGKMEVVVKLNELPDDVKTVDKAWKEFDIDTGEAIVTIAVKPKTFGLLEQAQQTYPSWVAAISGQMGQMTAKGFRLESAAIKVFERKAKDSSPSEDSTTKRSEPLPAKPTSQAISQPSGINLESKSLAQRVPNTESFQSPKTLPQIRLQQNQTARKKQPLSTAPAASASGQASFSVQVNAQVFVGHNSVTLNRRVLCIDGKPVAQSKLAIVIGQPKTMQADGSVTKGNDRSVLMSK